MPPPEAAATPREPSWEIAMATQLLAGAVLVIQEVPPFDELKMLVRPSPKRTRPLVEQAMRLVMAGPPTSGAQELPALTE